MNKAVPSSIDRPFASDAGLRPPRFLVCTDYSADLPRGVLEEPYEKAASVGGRNERLKVKRVRQVRFPVNRAVWPGARRHSLSLFTHKSMKTW